ncbi:coiled-coil domain-containing protein 112 isoform X2 [Myripristis murdjan]|uniref:coiled-coil domain-containing protein 112 isoform X2 n=1 Tax=Myripristis murdjan TaxID=586833 RepID=UPI0011761063|nr:coiled-coil domain-containing protein 112 isoform X2 [Myripristis murdjan]
MAALATTRKHGSQGEGDFSPQQSTPSPLSSHSVEERLGQQKAAQFLRDAERMRKQIEMLEKERTLGAQCRKNGWTDLFGELEDYERVLEEERNAEKINLQKQLVKIHNGVRKFQRQLTDVKPTPELIEKLKEIMTEVELSINTLKEDQHLSFEGLLKEESMCSQEIAAYETKIENWNLSVKLDSKRPPAVTVKTKPPDGDLPPDVRALESFLQRTGGPNGGWDEYDHKAFLRVWTKHSGQPAYRREAKLYLPGKMLEDIERHEEWYQELIHLQDRKREAIQRWKASKEQERQARMQRQQEVEQTEGKEKEGKTQAQQHRDEEERREAARRLEEWREERRRKEEQEEEQRLAEEIRKSRRAKEERRRQLEAKMAVEKQLRLRREDEEEQERRRREKEQREMEERRREAAVGIRCFQERDLHKVEAKLQLKQLKEQQEVERQQRITTKMKEKVEGHISRDPSRLTRPTKGWEERMKHIGPSGGGPVLQMFHRAVPSWRQGL